MLAVQVARESQAVWALVRRNFHLIRRYLGWEVVFLFYNVVNTLTIGLIGLAMPAGTARNREVVYLAIGALLWNFLSILFQEVSNSVQWERWEGTIEYTFMAPVSRLTHLLGVSSFAGVYALVRVVIVSLALLSFTHVAIGQANLFGCLVVLAVASIAFMGLGLIAAVLPLMSTENGAQATNIVQGVLLLISGIYAPVKYLPTWLQPLSRLSPATYALSACRKLLGIVPGQAQLVRGASLVSVLPDLGILLLFGLLTVPLGLAVFTVAERWAKRHGKLKRVG